MLDSDGSTRRNAQHPLGIRCPAASDPRLGSHRGRFRCPPLPAPPDRCLAHLKFQRTIQLVIQVQLDFVFPDRPGLVTAQAEGKHILVSGSYLSLVNQHNWVAPPQPPPPSRSPSISYPPAHWPAARCNKTSPGLERSW